MASDTLYIFDTATLTRIVKVSLGTDIHAITSLADDTGVLCLLADASTIVHVSWNGVERGRSTIPQHGRNFIGRR